MDGQFNKKLNQLLADLPVGSVAVQPWLDKRGIYRQLANAYVKSSWLIKLGRGAYMRKGDPVSWAGGLYAVQKQLGLAVHVGAQTALSMKGFSHYLPLGKLPELVLFAPPKVNLPAWFVDAPWPVRLVYIKTSLFSDNVTLGLTEYKTGLMTESGKESFSFTLSTPERAMMELIYLMPRHAQYEDAQLMMESLTTLRPDVVQDLLEDCCSIKVKRYFMWLAEHNQHKWVEQVNLDKVDFGKGKRTIYKGGHFDNKYQITVPDYYKHAL
jgi:hypothetical protein